MNGTIKGGIIMDDYVLFCRRCKSYQAHDEFFGYCWKFKCQARHDDSCKTIKEMI